MAFTRLLIANRGEIACRVIRTARAMGLETVAVYSEADVDAPHVALADRAVCIGPAAAADSYLSAARLLDAAARTGAQAVHPGYGFLSENAGFAQAVLDAGLAWVGPPPAAIAAMGDKAAAKERMRAAGVPVVPGAEGDRAALRDAAGALGLPLLVKAAAGGGGRGMRRVDDLADLPLALERAGAEALAASGSDRLLLERLVEGARHVEVQVLADAHGACLHLGERDCSVQRRHQKVIEEAPSPAVDPALRARMGAAAVSAAQAVGYVGAGTVELLLAADGSFYFLEMNTRLQVEHPVTEAVTGLDLVALQLRVARGEPLPLRQEQVSLRGHALELRIYAEDPWQGYLPQTGRLLAWRPPRGEGVRFDDGVIAGQEIGAAYDPMLAKLITWGEDRAQALERARGALAGLAALGVTTNRRWLSQVLAHPTFAAGEATTAFLDQVELPAPALSSESLAIAAALWLEGAGAPAAPLRTAHPFEQPLELEVDGERRTLWLGFEGGLQVRVVDARHAVTLRPGPGPLRRAVVDGVERPVHAALVDGRLHLEHGPEALRAEAWQPRAGGPAAGSGAATAPTSGRVVAVPAAVGAAVQAGETLVVLEAMKLETPVRAGVAGTVTEVRVAPGHVVKQGQVLVLVQPSEST